MGIGKGWLGSLAAGAMCVVAACSSSSGGGASDAGDEGRDPCSVDFGGTACCHDFGGTPAGAGDVCPSGLGLACQRGFGGYPDHCCFPPVVSDCHMSVDSGDSGTCTYPPANNDRACPPNPLSFDGKACESPAMPGLVCSYPGSGHVMENGCRATLLLSCVAGPDAGDAAADGGGAIWVVTD